MFLAIETRASHVILLQGWESDINDLLPRGFAVLRFLVLDGLGVMEEGIVTAIFHLWQDGLGVAELASLDHRKRVAASCQVLCYNA